MQRTNGGTGSAEIVRKFNGDWTMNLDEIIAAVDALPPDDREKVKAHLEKPQPKKWQNGEEWLALLDAAVDKFWGDTPPDERDAIIEAINTKSPPSEKGL
jgi:hypothetical protein